MAVDPALPPTLLIVEGSTELRYAEALFDGLPQPRPSLHILGNADPRKAIQRASALVQADPKRVWIWWDVDPQAGSVRARQLAAAVDRAETRGYQVGLSHPSFEYWLWLHEREPLPMQPPLPTSTWGARLHVNGVPYRKAQAFDTGWVIRHLPRAVAGAGEMAASAVLKRNPSTTLGALVNRLLRECGTA